MRYCYYHQQDCCPGLETRDPLVGIIAQNSLYLFRQSVNISLSGSIKKYLDHECLILPAAILIHLPNRRIIISLALYEIDKLVSYYLMNRP